MKRCVVLLLITGLVGCGAGRVGRPVPATKAVAFAAPVTAWVGPAKAEAKDEPKAPEPKADGKSASFWISALKDTDEQVQTGAAKSLRELAGDAVPVLVVALNDSDAKVRSKAARLMEEIGPPIGQPEAVAALCGRLKDANEKVRVNVAAALGYAGAESKTAVGPLTETLKDENEKVRAMAAWALGHIGPDARDSVPALTDALKEKSDAVCLNAFESLGQIGPASRPAIPALVEVVKQRGKSIPVDKLDAMQDIGPAVTPVLIEALKIADDDVRIVALSNLADVLKLPDEPQPELADEVRKQTQASIPAVVALLKDEKTSVRRKAVAVLGSFGPTAKETAPAIKELLEDKEPTVREKAAESLKKISGEKE